MQEGADELSPAGVMTQNISFFLRAAQTDMKEQLYLYTLVPQGNRPSSWDITSTGARYPKNTGIPKAQRELEGTVKREQGRIHGRR